MAARVDSRVSEPRTPASGPTRVPLSVLELVPRSRGMSPHTAMEESARTAELVDRLGYHRLWLAEHHGAEAFLSSATSVLVGHLAARTTGIRVGSGGVMLPNHAPLMVAEHYGTLAELYPGRIDLGLGRAPGTDPLTAAALQRGSGQLDTFARDVLDLVTYLGDGAEAADAPGHPRVRALPGEGTRVPLWMLGSSTGGAQVAAALGLPFSFASHFAPQQLELALRIYRERFDADAPTAQVDRPTVMAGVSVLVAPDRAEAEFLHSTTRLLGARIRAGRPAPLDPPVEDLASVLPQELLDVAGQGPMGVQAVGEPAEVVASLESFAAEHEVDELVVATYTYDPGLRRRSFALLAEAWGLAPRVSPRAAEPAASTGR